MLSNGDLDGDVYMTIWDKEIVESFGENHPPSENIKVNKNEIHSASETDHLCNYLQKDNLG
jgi:hypothetical protein